MSQEEPEWLYREGHSNTIEDLREMLSCLETAELSLASAQDSLKDANKVLDEAKSQHAEIRAIIEDLSTGLKEIARLEGKEF